MEGADGPPSRRARQKYLEVKQEIYANSTQNHAMRNSSASATRPLPSNLEWPMS